MRVCDNGLLKLPLRIIFTVRYNNTIIQATSPIPFIRFASIFLTRNITQMRVSVLLSDCQMWWLHNICMTK